MNSFRRRYTKKVVCIAGGFFLLASGATHAMMGKVSLKTLAIEAETILLGRVESIESHKKQIDLKPGQKAEVEFTLWGVAIIVVDKLIKGQVESQPILVEFNAGEDNPKYKIGEEVAVFLKKIEGKSSYSTVGLLQGKYTIIAGKVSRKEISVNEFIKKIKEVLAHQMKK